MIRLFQLWVQNFKKMPHLDLLKKTGATVGNTVGYKVVLQVSKCSMCLNHSFPLYDVTTDAIYQVACQHKEERIVVASLGGLKTTRSYYNQAFRPLSRPPQGTWNFQELHILNILHKLLCPSKKIEYQGVNFQKIPKQMLIW